MTTEQLKLVLEERAKWLTGDGGSRADLSGVDLPPVVLARVMRCPPTGSFTGWKQCRDGVIVKLEIPAHAKRSSAGGFKCRASEVIVDDVLGEAVGVSSWDPSVTYRVGQVVKCDQWNENRWVECGGGIHFFMSQEEAEAYVL